MADTKKDTDPVVIHPEARCEDCLGPNVVWFTPNALWNKVARKAGAPDPMLCPRCFILRAEATGIDVAWCVTPESPITLCDIADAKLRLMDARTAGINPPREPIRVLEREARQAEIQSVAWRGRAKAFRDAAELMAKDVAGNKVEQQGVIHAR